MVEEMVESLEAVVKQVKEKAAKFMADLSVRNEFTYAEAVSWLLANKKESPHIVRGAIVKAAVPNGLYEISVVFLNAGNGVVEVNGRPLGFKATAKSIDPELQNAFKGFNVVIVE